MNYKFLKDLLSAAEQFENQNIDGAYPDNIEGFKSWLLNPIQSTQEPDWEGKSNGRSPESVISTLIVHMNRYAKTYSRSAIHNSDFSTQEEFIYLINLKAFGAMSKMQLIKKNIHDKPVGMQIINRLLEKGWIQQVESQEDKRSKVISITEKGKEVLERQMPSIRQATNMVTGDLTHAEKMELIRLLKKLDNFHHPIFQENLSNEELLKTVNSKYT